MDILVMIQPHTTYYFQLISVFKHIEYLQYFRIQRRYIEWCHKWVINDSFCKNRLLKKCKYVSTEFKCNTSASSTSRLSDRQYDIREQFYVVWGQCINIFHDTNRYFTECVNHSYIYDYVIELLNIHYNMSLDETNSSLRS